VKEQKKKDLLIFGKFLKWGSDEPRKWFGFSKSQIPNPGQSS